MHGKNENDSNQRQPEGRPQVVQGPSTFWTTVSSFTMTAVSMLSRGFLLGLSDLEIRGHYAEFLELLEKRSNRSQRERGLITVSNHISVMDDPLIFGAIPLKKPGYCYSNFRWAFGSHDICFENRPFGVFFTLGQVLPTHRGKYSQYAGIFQPTVTQAIRLLSKGPFTPSPHQASPERQTWSRHNVCVDPFSEVAAAYTTIGTDAMLAPSSYANNSYSWVHIFPEGRIYQCADKSMRYFKWGVSRLILEASECPDVVPMWLEGFDDVLNEERRFPRFLPRPFKKVGITFGKKVEPEEVFGDLRVRWRELEKRVAEKHRSQTGGSESSSIAPQLGVLVDEELKGGEEAVALRIECTQRVRDLVLAVRSTRGLPPEDPRCALPEAWAEK